MKKLLSVLLSALILFSTISTGVVAYATPKCNYSDSYNELYYPKKSNRLASNKKAAQKLGFDATQSSKTYTYNGKTYYTLGKELYKSVRNKMVARSVSIPINICLSDYYSPYSTYDDYEMCDIIDDIILAAFSDEISSSPVDGDYLRWQYDSYRRFFHYQDGYGVYKNGKYFYTLSVEMKYYSTASQEKQVDNVVNGFINSFDVNKLSDYEIIKKVHDFILGKTVYDYDAAYNINSYTTKYNYAFSAWGTLVKGSSVCQGYALAFYRIAKELGYKTRLVYSDPYEGCHAWNIVELNEKYYFVDATWDDDDDPAARMDYFLVDYDTLRSQDSYLNEHTLYAVQDTDYFINTYKSKLAKASYDRANSFLLSSCSVSLSTKTYTYNGSAKTPVVNVTDRFGNVVSPKYYKVSYSSNVNSGLGKVTVKGVEGTSYADSSSKKYITIKPSKANSIKADSSKTTSSSLTLKYTKNASKSTAYTIYMYKDGAWKAVKNTTATSVTFKDLNSNTTYSFKVAEYKTVNNHAIYGASSSTYTTCTKPKTPTISSVSTKSKAITVKWKKIGCNNFQVQYSTKSNMSGAKTYTVSSNTTSKKISKLKKDKKYYVRVRAIKVKKIGGKTFKYYSNWSSKKSIKVK